MPKLRDTSKQIQKPAPPKETRGAKAKKALEKKEFERRKNALMTSCLTNRTKDVVEDDVFKRMRLE